MKVRALFCAGCFFAVFLAFLQHDAVAYVGPGAGFAVISSFLVLLLTGMVAFLTLLIWPFRAVWLFARRRALSSNRKVRRVVVLGLDGMDPGLANRFMKEGVLQNFSSLKAQGVFRPLRTTAPSISPVAWSTFATGVNPGKHRIFDFYTRDLRTYLPVLSSVEISTKKRESRLGPFKFTHRKPTVRFLRKSTSFWKVLGGRGVFCSIIRVPITFPPEEFYGTCLSAMCTPDIRGTQGTFSYLTTEKGYEKKDDFAEGVGVPITLNGDKFIVDLEGPSLQVNGRPKALTIRLQGRIKADKDEVELTAGKERFCLRCGEYSPWIKLAFSSGPRGRVTGIARFMLFATKPELRIYVSPINIDPERPALPISHPLIYSMSLSRLYGPFATLGLAEDTWGLNERVLDEGSFLRQAYDIYEERRRHFLEELKKNKNGLVVGVFDTTDRIQHMFMRYLDPEHPANRDKDILEHREAIRNLYVKMDELLGEVMNALGKDDVLMVISDHGFSQFKWGINLNSWLWREGYLVLKDGAEPGGIWFKGIDWSKTRAYGYGLTGIFLNVIGREAQGIVEPGKPRAALQDELKHKLLSLMDPVTGRNPIRRVLLSKETLTGPYVNDAPELIVGYRRGFRASWNSAVGRITDEIFEENTRSWSGDHSIDPALVPGVLFSNLMCKEKSPALMDLAPTILSLFGLPKEPYHDGQILNMERRNGTGAAH